MIKQLGTYALAAFGIMTLLSVAFVSATAIISVALVYTLFVVLPGLVWVAPLREGPVQTFLLSNIAGFSFMAVLVPLDIWAGAPMNKLTFSLVALIAIITGFLRWRTHYFGKSAVEKPSEEAAPSEAQNL